MPRRKDLRNAFIFFQLCVPVWSFYLPGTAPRDYSQGDLVPLLVNALTPQISAHSKLKSVISYDYYHPQLHFCQPPQGPASQRESFGSILFGDRLYDSPFEIQMRKNETCKKLCDSNIPATDAGFVNQAIQDRYALNWLLDGLPAAELKRDDGSGETFYSIGFSMGQVQEPVPVLHNHYNIFLEYHVRNGKYRVVGALVWPASLDASASRTCDLESGQPMRLSEKTDNAVPFTYSVIWTESATPWATRWDHYLHIFDPKIHWFSLINSIVIVAFLCVMVGMILMRTVARDIGRYNAIDQIDDVQEDLDGNYYMGKCLGTGAAHATFGSHWEWSSTCGHGYCHPCFRIVGFLSPANRGSLSTVMIVTWTLFSYVAGHASLRCVECFKFVPGRFRCSRGRTIRYDACDHRDVVFNLSTFGLGWLYHGLSERTVADPRSSQPNSKTNPPTVWYMRFWPSALMAGILPFGAGFIECYFLLSSLFGNKVYYAAGFLFLTFTVVGLTTATVTVLMCYFHLCQEDYRWHERAFVTGGASAFWLVAYGLLYATRLSLHGFTSIALYLGYLLLLGY
ncbi:hypothetical protein H4Q26_015582 [Puccinia striiformis f. sp. tritici PST-130]|nr:hypothetical protein H4Q26_015582 [Puccinia striiformis f. sp. tritici PST-130]